jgi:hypothetical protein
LLFYWTKLTNLLVDGHQVGAELLQAMELSYFLLGFMQSCGGRKAFGDGLALHSEGQTELGIMAWVVGLSAMAGRLATLPNHGGNRARSKVSETQELLQELGTAGF